MSRVQTEASVQELYIGILGRAADSAGLKYWTDAIENGSQSLENTRASFATPNQPEYWSIYGGLSSTSLVDKVYQNFLERTPDSAGKAYWVSELNSGKISADFFVSAVINAAKDSSATDPQTLTDAKVLANKVQSAQYFTGNTQNADTKSSSFLSKAKDAVDSVTDSASTVSASKGITDTYASGLPKPAVYDDRTTDAAGKWFYVSDPTTKVTAETHIDGVYGLRYQDAKGVGYRDTGDAYELTASKSGVLTVKLTGYEVGSSIPNVDIFIKPDTIVSAESNYTDRLILNGNSNHTYTYSGKVDVFVGEHVVINVVGGFINEAGHGTNYTLDFALS